jgi:Flp pilus assembly protein TadB
MTLAAAVLTASTVLLLLPTYARAPSTTPEPGEQSSLERSLLLRLRPLLVVVAAAGGWSMSGGVVGVAVGATCAAIVWVAVGRSEDPAVVRHREELRADLPTGVDLLAACLDAGAAPESALVSVSRALGGAVGREFRAIHHRLEVGVDPGQVWRAVAAHPQLGPLGRAVGRAHTTGASVGEAVHRLARELRDRVRADVETRARTIEVKAAAPLGLCLLPAFVLLGVVPMVAGLFGSMELLR